MNETEPRKHRLVLCPIETTIEQYKVVDACYVCSLSVLSDVKSIIFTCDVLKSRSMTSSCPQVSIHELISSFEANFSNSDSKSFVNISRSHYCNISNRKLGQIFGRVLQNSLMPCTIIHETSVL